MKKRSAQTIEHIRALGRKNQKTYNDKLNAKAAAGDKKAIAQKARNNRNKRASAAKNFILKDATLEEISMFRDLLAQRVKLLKGKKNKKD